MRINSNHQAPSNIPAPTIVLALEHYAIAPGEILHWAKRHVTDVTGDWCRRLRANGEFDLRHLASDSPLRQVEKSKGPR